MLPHPPHLATTHLANVKGAASQGALNENPLQGLADGDLSELLLDAGFEVEEATELLRRYAQGAEAPVRELVVRSCPI